MCYRTLDKINAYRPGGQRAEFDKLQAGCADLQGEFRLALCRQLQSRRPAGSSGFISGIQRFNADAGGRLFFNHR